MKEEKGTKLSSYNLPIKKQESTREGFGPTEKKQWYNLAELTYGDPAGTTETDSKTNAKSPGYSKINEKSGNGLSAPGKNQGLIVKLDKNARIG